MSTLKSKLEDHKLLQLIEKGLDEDSEVANKLAVTLTVCLGSLELLFELNEQMDAFPQLLDNIEADSNDLLDELNGFPTKGNSSTH